MANLKKAFDRLVNRPSSRLLAGPAGDGSPAGSGSQHDPVFRALFLATWWTAAILNITFAVPSNPHPGSGWFVLLVPLAMTIATVCSRPSRQDPDATLVKMTCIASATAFVGMGNQTGSGVQYVGALVFCLLAIAMSTRWGRF